MAGEPLEVERLSGESVELVGKCRTDCRWQQVDRLGRAADLSLKLRSAGESGE